MRSYHSNPADFKKYYIDREQRTSIPIGMLEGTAVHKGIERYINGQSSVTSEDLLGFSLQAGQEPNWGKTGSKEKSVLTIDRCLARFFELSDERQYDWCEVESEEGFTVDMGGWKLKGYMDAIETIGNQSCIIDFKTVRSCSYTLPLAYYLQALTYKIICDIVGYDVVEAQFIELSKSEKTSIPWKIHRMTEFPMEHIFALQEYYRLTFEEITKGERHWLPNLFGAFEEENQLQWVEWVNRVMNNT